ncbi:protein n-lysine methyltransferase mettl20 [Phtheirospermum japonicum]|uniref:Protein n-lysine methyltransferase mettl20 n=1 Tax=Phtheirospermum japonicum TaxID=374723 RepID=A0A830C9Y7_9LAMI|nr:protein n-lysine methyltransferase mettl20 [Phtheirospermum japonicum]
MDIALFSPSSLFAGSDDSSSEEEKTETHENYEERKHQFPGMELLVREFSFHQLNANLLWPGTFAFAEWLVQHRPWVEAKRVLELGSGTGALAIFLRNTFQLDITTSDYDDAEIEENIAYNCRINGVNPFLPHIRHSWGDVFPISEPDWDLIIASDILLYVKQYPNLIKSLSFLLKSYKSKATEAVARNSGHDDECPLSRPAFLMSWRRRIGKDDESLFFSGCEEADLKVEHLGNFEELLDLGQWLQVIAGVLSLLVRRVLLLSRQCRTSHQKCIQVLKDKQLNYELLSRINSQHPPSVRSPVPEIVVAPTAVAHVVAQTHYTSTPLLAELVSLPLTPPYASVAAPRSPFK